MRALLYYTHNAKPRAFMEPLYMRHRNLAADLGAQWLAVVRAAQAEADYRRTTEQHLYRHRAQRMMDDLKARS